MVNLYGQRWKIELLFGRLKSRGFCWTAPHFEDTYQRIDQRINTMIFVLFLALCEAVKTNKWLLEHGYSIPVKNLGKRQTKLFSFSRIGLDQPPGGPAKVYMINHLDFKPLVPLLSFTYVSH